MLSHVLKREIELTTLAVTQDFISGRLLFFFIKNNTFTLGTVNYLHQKTQCPTGQTHTPQFHARRPHQTISRWYRTVPNTLYPLISRLLRRAQGLTLKEL